MKNLGLIALLVIIISCNNVAKKIDDAETPANLSKIKQMEWLIGQWESKSDEGDFYETWIKTNDSVLSATSCMIANTDTVFVEKISLEQKQNELYYVTAVNNQNNAKPIAFKLVSGENAEAVFENKNHDFPQRIIYKNPHPDSLYACVEGNQNGAFRKEEFLLSRKKQ